MRQSLTIIVSFLLISTLAACRDPWQDIASPDALLEPGTFRITMEDQEFTGDVVRTQGPQDDTLITMAFDEGRIEMVFPGSLESGTYRGCRMALYETGQCIDDPLGVRFVSIEGGVESESENYADLSLTLWTTEPLAGSFRIVPDGKPIIEGTFHSP